MTIEQNAPAGEINLQNLEKWMYIFYYRHFYRKILFYLKKA